MKWNWGRGRVYRCVQCIGLGVGIQSPDVHVYSGVWAFRGQMCTCIFRCMSLGMGIQSPDVHMHVQVCEPERGYSGTTCAQTCPGVWAWEWALRGQRRCPLLPLFIKLPWDRLSLNCKFTFSAKLPGPRALRICLSAPHPDVGWGHRPGKQIFCMGAEYSNSGLHLHACRTSALAHWTILPAPEMKYLSAWKTNY